MVKWFKMKRCYARGDMLLIFSWYFRAQWAHNRRDRVLEITMNTTSSDESILERWMPKPYRWSSTSGKERCPSDERVKKR
jgi:hypothetical protein